MPLLRKLIVVCLLLGAGIYAFQYYLSHRPPAAWEFPGAPENELQVLQRAIYYIRNNYVGPDRVNARNMLREGLEVLQQNVAPVMTHWNDNSFSVEVAGNERLYEIPENLKLQDIAFIFGHVLDFINANLPEKRSEDSDKLEYLLIDGVVSTLDPHTSFLRPKVYSEFRIGTSGNFGGIGISIGIRDGYLTVIAPLEGTPAADAGLEAGDRIIQVGEERTINMSLTEAVERLRGEIGTKVTILVQREGMKDPLEFTIRRALISIESVKAELLEDQVALLKIKNFQEDTASELLQATERLDEEANGLKGIILDLRNNPGGLLDQSVAVADAFLSDGVIVSTVGINDQLNEEDYAHKDNVLEDVPMIVLVNAGSASASEILAGALQVHNRALIIGNRTFGKGTVQTLYDMRDGSALKLTIAKYLAAGKEDVQAYGITPDLAMIPARVSDERVDLKENKVRREHELDEYLQTQPIASNAEPLFKLYYLNAEDDPEAISGTVQLAHDYPVELAHTILKESHSSSRELSINYVKDNISRFIAEQDKIIALRLQDYGINWEQGKSTKKPEADIDFWITQDDQKIDEVTGGTDIKLHLKVTNKGKGSFYRLLAVSESDNGWLDNLEFPFGKIDPGESRTYSVPVSLPPESASQVVPVTLTFTETNDEAPEAKVVPISVRLADAPRFAYEWWLSTPNTEIKPGEDVDVTFRVENVGTGPTEDAVINLINKEGDRIFLKKGRVPLESIKPGESREATLSFRLKDKFEKETASLEVSIEDRKSGAILRDELKLSFNGLPHDPPMLEKQLPPFLTLDLPENPYWSDGSSYRLKGKASDDHQIKEIYAFVNIDKVFYQSNHNAATREMPFNLKIPLKEGANRITVIAKDDGDLVTSEHWVVWKPE